jgi:hypothetical protein
MLSYDVKLFAMYNIVAIASKPSFALNGVSHQSTNT